MRPDESASQDVDRNIAERLEQLYVVVRDQAAAERDDSRRGGILESLKALLEQPRRAANLLTTHNDARGG